MDNLFQKLNKEQQEAVLYNDGPLAIIAGAGTGKTRTITYKVAYLIKKQNVKPERILAVTFSNKAAREMKERIINLVGGEANKAQISTYHSLCVRILREDIDKLGISRHFNIIDSIDQKMILRPGYKKFNLSSKGIPHKAIVEYISRNKFLKKSTDELKSEVNTEYEKGLFNLYKYYRKETQRTNSLDFDDLILVTEQLFTKFSNIAKKWGEKYDYILADEFQDTSSFQYSILKKLAHHQQITVVGDPDQTIYSWRRADSRLLTNFQKDFTNTKIVLLIENYRSTPNVLRAANRLISHNKRNRIAKDLFTTRKPGAEIEFFHGFSEDAEARWIVQQIQMLRKNKTQLKNIAILFRANYLSNPLERALIKEEIDYVLFGSIRFYQRSEIKDAIAFLKVINDGDEVALRRIINVPPRKIGTISVDKIFALEQITKNNLFDTIIKNFGKLEIPRAALEGLAKLINLVRKYRIALKTNSIATVLEKFLVEINYYSIIPQDEEGRIESLRQLINSLEIWEKNNPEKTLNDFLIEIALFVDKDESNRSNDYISLMTVHTAKGLEFDNIFIFGFSEGIFPSKKALDEGGDLGLEEERRLAYVAATRTKKALYITSSRGYNIEHTMQKKPSRFLKELGIDYRRFTSEFIAPLDFSENYEDKALIEGDKVLHEKFGEGVILNVSGEVATINFQKPYGQKMMMKNHKSLKRIGE